MDTNQLVKSLLLSDSNALGILDIFLAMTVPFVLCLFIALFYKKTTNNNHYSMNFILCMPLFGSLTSIITLLIGSNIARAFGLVGALSLIRFRTAVKEPLDSIFLFWSLAIGMACGTGFYLAAVMIVIMGITYMAVLYKIKFSQDDQVFLIMKAWLPNNSSDKLVQEFEKKCLTYFSNLHSLNMYTSSEGEHDQFIYSVKLKKRMGTNTLMKELKGIEGIYNIELVNQDSALYI